MIEALKKFEATKPEIVFKWSDAETEAEGWVVINSLRGGAAGGGTRMRVGLTEHEVLSLAKTMEIKFTVAGPAIGGAKSGINFDPNDPRKKGVLKRWYAAVRPLLKNYYGTGGDLNVDEIHEVIPITQEYGILHPQEGVLVGHFSPDANEKQLKISQLQNGVLLPVKNPQLTPNPDRSYTVADLITGYGVAEGVRHYYDVYGGQLEGKRAIIQGWGNVGAAAAFYLSQAGVRIVGIIDRVGGIINTQGLTHEEIVTLFNNKTSNFLVADELLSFDATNEKIWDVGAEIFIPAAASRLVTQSQLDSLLNKGLEVISSGANVPFADDQIFYGPIAQYADQKCAVIPDFISNCGMARTFAYLMETGIDMTDNGIFEDTSTIIRNAIVKTAQKDRSTVRITERAYEIALQQIS
ncbi:MAG: amino acid dehydrogenase [Schleiferiaceae bacterium]|nr:amino acid dehydrogenase [Schleiferiaceae bacterium]